MKLSITHACTDTGSDFHKQTLYHVPSETARQIASDFEAFRTGAPDASTCKTYEYALDPPPSEETGPTDPDEGERSGDADGPVVRTEDRTSETVPQGLLSIDFRTVVAVQGYDPLS